MYAAYFGLNKEPFRLTPDPRFLHLAEPHRNTLKSMLEGVSLRKGLQVALGPIGTGKTTLLYCLQHILAHESSPERPIRSAFLVNPVLEQEELFEALFEELEISSAAATKPARLRAIHELLLDCHRRNGAVVIIIDESHLLPPALIEEIRLLLNLDNYPVNVLQVILSGQPELTDLLRKPQSAALRGRVAVVSRLRPLTLTECRAYIAERLYIAGLRHEVPFTTPALEQIYRLSNGVPRVINLLCDRAMMTAYRRRVNRVGPEIVDEAAEGSALLEFVPDVAGSAASGEITSIVSGSTPQKQAFAGHELNLAGTDE